MGKASFLGNLQLVLQSKINDVSRRKPQKPDVKNIFTLNIEMKTTIYTLHFNTKE